MKKSEWWVEYPIEKKLKEMGYYEKYEQVYFEKNEESLSDIYGKFPGGYLTMPKGMAGYDLWQLRKSLEKEYRELESGRGELEVKARGADSDFTQTKL